MGEEKRKRLSFGGGKKGLSWLIPCRGRVHGRLKGAAATLAGVEGKPYRVKSLVAVPEDKKRSVWRKNLGVELRMRQFTEPYGRGS